MGKSLPIQEARTRCDASYRTQNTPFFGFLFIMIKAKRERLCALFAFSMLTARSRYKNRITPQTLCPVGTNRLSSRPTSYQCCSKAKDFEVEAKDFKNFSRPRPKTHKSRPKLRTWIKDNGHFSDFSMKSQNVGHLVMK